MRLFDTMYVDEVGGNLLYITILINSVAKFVSWISLINQMSILLSAHEQTSRWIELNFCEESKKRFILTIHNSFMYIQVF